MKPTLYIMIGCPRSGKSTYVENNFKGLKIVSRDYFRETLLGFKGNMNHEGLITEAFNNKMNELFENKYSFVIDNTSISKKYRKEFIKLGKLNSYNIIGVYIKTNKDICLKRAVETNFPIHVIETMFNKIEEPSIEEGFDSLIIITKEGVLKC